MAGKAVEDENSSNDNWSEDGVGGCHHEQGHRVGYMFHVSTPPLLSTFQCGQCYTIGA